MNKKHTDESRLIERYLAVELSDSEREAFEERVLSSPALLDELEAEERLQQGLQDVTALEMANAPADRSTDHARSATKWLVIFAETTDFGDEVKKAAQDHVGPIIDALSVVTCLSAYTINTPQGEETILYIRLEDLPGI